jgi:hypothetical protein
MDGNIIHEDFEGNEHLICYSDPTCNRVIDTLNYFQSYYVFKETEDACLIAEDIIINPGNMAQVKGWVKKENTIPWNFNLVFEVNWDQASLDERDSSGLHAKIFESPADAEKYYINRTKSEYANMLFEEDIPKTKCRCYSQISRFPLIKHSDKNVWEVEVIRSLAGQDEERIPREVFDKVKHIIDSMAVNNDSIHVMIALTKGVLKGMGLSDGQIASVLGEEIKNNMKGYTMQTSPFLKHPLFLNVLLLKYNDLYSIRYELERSVPPVVFRLSIEEFRKNIPDIWYSILVENLHYFPPVPEMIDELTLDQLSTILTGYQGRPGYKTIKLKDVADPAKFSDEDLYLCLIDWMISKGHVQSNIEKRNMLTRDFFEEHVACYFIEYLIVYLENNDIDVTQLLNCTRIQHGPRCL